MKGALAVRPVFHHREDRIRAHVQLCWLALLLLRVVENATDDTWRNVRDELDRMHLVTLATADGQVAQRSTLTAGHKVILAALELPEPLHDHINCVPIICGSPACGEQRSAPPSARPSPVRQRSATRTFR